MTRASSWIEPIAGAVRLHLRVQPRASRNEVSGRLGYELKIRLAAPPVDGAANDALVRFLAQALGVPRASVSIVAGGSSRSKVVEVRGVEERSVQARLGMPPR